MAPRLAPLDRDAAERHLRVPFVDRGRSFAGWDCWGLVMVLTRHHAGVEMPEYATSAADSVGVVRSFAGGISDADVWLPVDLDQARPFDVAVMRATATIDGRTRRVPFHAALFIDRTRLLHSEKDLDTMSLTVTSDEFRRRLVCLRRFRGLA